MIISSFLVNGKSIYRGIGKYPYHTNGKVLTEGMGKVLDIYKRKG